MNECSILGCQDQTYSINVTRNSKPYIINYKKCKPHWSMHLSSYQKKKDRYQSKAGYIIVKVDGKWRAEHTVLMEKKLDRRLNPNESVHHINGKRNDNRIDNLELWLGAIRYGQRASEVICPHCDKPYLTNPLK